MRVAEAGGRRDAAWRGVPLEGQQGLTDCGLPQGVAQDRLATHELCTHVQIKNWALLAFAPGLFTAAPKSNQRTRSMTTLRVRAFISEEACAVLSDRSLTSEERCRS